MRAMLKSHIALAALALAASQANAQSLNTFTLQSTGYAVSADGKWATFGTPSSAGGSAVGLWSVQNSMMTDIGGLAGGSGRIVISADGSTIAASTMNASGKLVASVYSTSTGSWTALPTLGGSVGVLASDSWSISADGRYVGGSAYLGSSSRPSLTDTVTGTTIDISGVAGRVQGISPGAQTLIGYTTSSQAGAMWKLNSGGTYTLTTLKDPNTPANTLNSTAAMSGNGLWAAGNSFNGVNDKPYRVDLGTGEVQFFGKIGTTLGTGKITASVGSISADGNTIVGIESPQGATLPGSFGFIWKADGTFNSATHTLGGTTMNFDDYLAGYGIDLDNHYNFVSVIGMSADATVFNGIAIDNLTGGQVSFIVTVPVPEPSQYALLAAGLGVLAWVARRRKRA